MITVTEKNTTVVTDWIESINTAVNMTNEKKIPKSSSNTVNLRSNNKRQSDVADNKDTPVKHVPPILLDLDEEASGSNQMENFESALWPLLEIRLNTWMTSFAEKKVEEAAAKAVNDYISSEFFKEDIKNTVDKLKVIPTLALDPIKAKCDDLEQYSRRNNIRIIGVPESAEENTDAIIMQLMKEKLGVEVKESDICRSHRVGRKKPGQQRQIIVKFTRHNVKSSIMRKKKVLRNAGDDLKIQEDLTQGRLDAIKKLNNEHKEKILTLWTIDGSINIRQKSNSEQILSVRKLIDLDKVMSKLVSGP